jgi:glycosyltransferase involved in cell wall biosynthesis
VPRLSEEQTKKTSFFEQLPPEGEGLDSKEIGTTKMKIGFVKTADNNMASVRYRINLPAAALLNRGHEVKMVDSYFTLKDYQHKLDYHIFGKHFNPDGDYQTANIIKDDGGKVVFDICDNHFENQYAPYYKAMCSLADVVTCNTPVMQDIIKSYTGKNSQIIDDPYEYEELEPQFTPGQNPIQILWYGHFTNLNTVEVMGKDLRKLEESINLTVLSNMRSKAPVEDHNIFITFLTWNSDLQRKLIEKTNFIALPTILNDDTKRTKSHNRLVEGIRSGRFVLAYPLPSYERFKDFCWVGEDFSDGICWADDNPEQVLQRIKDGQEYLKETLSPDHIAQQWEKILGE